MRLTLRQWDAILDKLPRSWLFKWVVEEGKISDDGKKVEVLHLPDVWRAVADDLIETYFTTGSIRKVSAPLFDGVRRIVKQTNARTEHPAFAGVAVEGRQFEVLPAWRYPEGSNGRTLYSPWILSDTELSASQWGQAVRTDDASALGDVASKMRQPQVGGVVRSSPRGRDDVVDARRTETGRGQDYGLPTEVADAVIALERRSERAVGLGGAPVVGPGPAGRGAVSARPPGTGGLLDGDATFHAHAVSHGHNVIRNEMALCSLWPEHRRKSGVVFTEWHHSTMRTTGPISVDAYDRFIKARSAA